MYKPNLAHFPIHESERHHILDFDFIRNTLFRGQTTPITKELTRIFVSKGALHNEFLLCNSPFSL